MSGPLTGMRIVEMGGIGPAPFAGALLGDMGADVVRIDRIGRGAFEQPPRFDFYNRNKRSAAFDLKRPEAVAAVLRLVGQADALIEGFRPGVMERLGLGPDAALAANPRLVYARMTGWGQTGPIAQEAGHDINYLALTGALHALGEPDRPPPPPPPLNLVADLGGGALYLTVGLLAAVIEARQSGRGQTLDVAMIDGVTNLMSAFQAFRQQGVWTSERGDNILDGGAPFYRCYETRDGKHVAVGALEPNFYANLLACLGLDPAALPAQNDRAAWPDLRERFAAIFRTRTQEEWVAAVAGREACVAPVLSLDEAPRHPQMRARGVYAAFDGVRHPAPAPRFDRTPSELRRPCPAAGADSREVLADWGFSADETAGLEASGALAQRTG